MNFGTGFMTITQVIPLADTWDMHGDVGTGWMSLMMIVMVLFWGAIIFGAVWLIRGALDGRPGRGRETPTEVLERRFAEGTISVEDYRARREVLVNGGAQANVPHTDEPLAAPPREGGKQ